MFSGDDNHRGRVGRTSEIAPRLVCVPHVFRPSYVQQLITDETKPKYNWQASKGHVEDCD